MINPSEIIDKNELNALFALHTEDKINQIWNMVQ